MRYTLLIPVLVLAASACEAKTETDEANAPAATESLPAPTPPASPETGAIMTADVMAEAGSTLTGQVQVMAPTVAEDAFRIAVNLQALPAGAHDWHIHQGACGVKDSPVVVPFTTDKDKPGIAAPLTAGPDGAVSANVGVPSSMLTLDQIKAGDYSLHVHQKSGADHGATIGCSNL